MKKQFKDLALGERFIDGFDNVWQKRDSTTAELIDRHGCVSFINGKRCITNCDAKKEYVIKQ